MGGYFAVLAATAMQLLRIDVPLRTIAAIVSAHRLSAALALGGGLFVRGASYAAQEEWATLATLTLELSQRLLGLVEPDVVLDLARRTIRVGNFEVEISPVCSGYEGIGLVASFLAIYLWAFRSRLRFPEALLLFPIGIAAVWLLNVVRIAALTLIGAHVSPEVAIHGFHSQAGWMVFLAVTLGMMMLGSRSSLFAIMPGTAALSGDRTVLGFLAPFTALMLGSVVMSAAAPFDNPFYVVKALAGGVTLLCLRDVYHRFSWIISGEAVAVGLLVGRLTQRVLPKSLLRLDSSHLRHRF